jgi:hypothetical protein
MRFIPEFVVEIKGQTIQSCTSNIMALRLAASQLEFIHDMINSKSLTTSQMAEAAGCSNKRSIINTRSNLRLFGNI